MEISSDEAQNANYSSSDSEMPKKLKAIKQSPINLRDRIKKNYKEKKYDENLEDSNHNNQDGTNESIKNNNQFVGVFNPEIEQILWKKEKIDEDGRDKIEYLVKFRGVSYLHLKWIEEKELMAYSNNMKIRISRFNKTFERKISELDDIELTNQANYFDSTFLEIDRVIYTTDLFCIIHPKKANEIKGKWSELIALVTSKLLNFTKNNIHYGIFFMEPVDPDRDGLTDYQKVISQPMDLGTLLNRIYLDYYKSPQNFWVDLGLVFKNCRKYYKESTLEVRKLCDTLREAAIELYKQWYNLTTQKHQKLIQDYQDQQIVKKKEKGRDKLEEAKKAKENEQKSKSNELKNLAMQFEKFQAKNNLTLTSFKDTVNFKKQIQQFITNSPELFKNKVNIDEIAHIIICFSSKSSNNSSSTSSGMPGTTANGAQKMQEESPSLSAGNVNKYESRLLSIQEIEQWNPGRFSFSWLADEGSKSQIKNESREYLNDDDVKELDLLKDIDKLYLIKWKNLSYLDTTWEHESVLGPSNKFNDYHFFNRSLDKESRAQVLNQYKLHKLYLDYTTDPKNLLKLSNEHIEELKNKLYLYNISTYKNIFQYTIANQPVYKDRKLLRDYQLESLNWLISAWYNQRNVILADEMGLGKTIQSIAFLNHLYNFEGCKGPFLVLAPLSTLEHWRRTVDEWTNMNGVLYYDLNSAEGRESCRAYEWYHIEVSTKGTIVHSIELYKFQILITSYEVFLQDLSTVFLNIPIQFIIVDEAHRLKNTNARILNSLKQLPCKRILLLTGTPIQNNTEELWSLLNYIEPKKFNSTKDFLKEFGDLSNAEQVEKLHKVLKPYILRRKKEEVEASIPPLQETIINVEMTNTQKTIYRALYERNKILLSKGLSGASTNLNTSLNNLEVQLRKCCNHPFLLAGIEEELTKDVQSNEEKQMKLIESSGKMILLDKLLPKLKNEGKKVLIFSQFTHMLAILEDFLHLRGYKYEKIDGSVKSKERQNAIDRFNDPTKKRDIFLLSTKAGGLGINLTSANIVIIFDSDWNPQNDVQAAARAHRIGQKNEVQVYRLITSKTYESEMFERASKKLGLDQAIFIGGAFQSTNNDSNSRNLGQIEEGINKKGVTKHEIETLLKKGILGLLNDDNNESQKFMEEDIDDILKKNTQLAKYSLINGTYTFSKSSFISEKADVNININDPNFWELVLKNRESAAKLLLAEFEEKKEFLKELEEQKKFMDKICDCMYKVIENKINIIGYNVDDEKNIMDILGKISSSRHFHQAYKDIALNWIYELAKPSRKIKKPYIPLPSEIINGLQMKKKVVKDNKDNSNKLINKANQGENQNEMQNDGEASEGISIYNEGDDDDDDDEGDNHGDGNGEDKNGVKENGLRNNDEDEDGHTIKKPKRSKKPKEDILKKACFYCARVRCSIFCKGPCKRAFHAKCRRKFENGEMSEVVEDTEIDFDIEERLIDVERLRQNIDIK